MIVKSIWTGGRFEKVGSYCRVKRVGPFVVVAGTTAMMAGGVVHAPNDTYAQAIHILRVIEGALHQVGAEMKHIVRTRAFLTDMANVGEFVRAHGEIFAGIDPVTSAVSAGLTAPGLMIEIEADAIIHTPDGPLDLR